MNSGWYVNRSMGRRGINSTLSHYPIGVRHETCNVCWEYLGAQHSSNRLRHAQTCLNVVGNELRHSLKCPLAHIFQALTRSFRTSCIPHEEFLVDIRAEEIGAS